MADFAERVRAFQAEEEAGAATNAPPDFAARVRAFEQEQQQQQAQQVFKQFSAPTQEEITASVDRLQRMEQFKAYAQQLEQTMGTPAPRPPTLGEKVVGPVLNIGKAIGTAIKRPTIDPSDPQTQQTLGARPGVPFEASEGVSFMDRMGLQFTFNQAESAYSLMAANPNVTDVRFNQLGDPIVTVKDPKTGDVKDVLANPVGIDSGDFAFVLANAPALLTGGAAAIGRDPRTLTGASRLARWWLSRDVNPTVVRSALAGESAGLATDLLARGAKTHAGELPEVDITGAAVRRGEMTLADLFYGKAFGETAKLGTRAVTPFSKRGPLQVNAEAASKLWENEGIFYVRTPAEVTGSPFLGRSEAFAAQKPGSAGVFGGMQEAKRAQAEQFQRIMLGMDPSAVPPADIVGEKALSAIGARLTPLDTVIDRSSQEVLDLASREIKDKVVAATGIPAPVATSAVGQSLFKGAEARYAAFQAEKARLYDVVKQNPLIAGQGRNIDVTPLANDAKRLLGDMAAVEKTVATPAGPVTQTTRLVDAFNPKSVDTLNRLASAQGGRIGYADLIDLRHEIGAAKDGGILAGIAEGRLDQLYATLTRNIEQGLDSLDKSGSLRKAWETANDYTATTTQQFKNVDILPIFKDPTQRGALDLYDIVTKATSNPGRWMAYRDFYGAGSTEMALLRRAYADQLLGRTIGSDVINGSSFASRLTSAYNNPSQAEILGDVFGAASTVKLKRLGDVAEAASKVGNVDATELAQHLEAGTLTKQVLEDLGRVQGLRELTYRNAQLKQMHKGEFRAEPSQFVDNFVFSKGAEPRDVREWMSLISDPTIRDEVRMRTLVRMFQESTSGPVGQERIRGTLLDRFLGNEKDNMIGDRVRAVVGDEDFKKLRAWADLTAPDDVAHGMYKGAGGIAGGMAISNLEKQFLSPTGLPSVAGGMLRSFLMALGYKWGPVRGYISNNALGEAGTLADRAAFVNGLMAGAPALEEFTRLLGSEADRYGRFLTIDFKNRLDRDAREGQQQPQQ